MIKKAKTYLNDYVISRRWFMLTVHGITVVVLITAGLFTIFDWVSRLDFFVAGLVTALGLQNAMIPGLFKGISKADQAVLRAQFEKEFTEAIAELKRQHPEIGDIQVTRVQ